MEALPYEGRVFCTWEVTLAPSHLAERLVQLPADRAHQLDTARRLAGALGEA
ncbi:hypothetical protein [Actinoplanes sp. M2I2]|uniref:hypothetical protein n=1 Tax=Actinoplanes sp. M2I2 TaxID=1734444 RepID=UPI0020213CC6|nr:hypothetical protein [Actinoplanes sp. M2I2]